MPIKSRFFSFIPVLLLPIAILPSLQAQSVEDELHYTAAHLLVFGTMPDGLPEALPEDGLISAIQHCQTVLQNASPDEKNNVRERAWIDTTGTASDPNSSIDALSYHEYVFELTNRLEKSPSAYEQVIRRAYPYVIFRDVYDEEIDYWKQFPTMGYATLVGCIEDWARRNQPGLMVTGGNPTISVNCEFLTTLQLAPALADEVRAFLNLPMPDPQLPNNVIAKGAESVISSGGIHFLLTGTPDLRKLR